MDDKTLFHSIRNPPSTPDSYSYDDIEILEQSLSETDWLAWQSLDESEQTFYICQALYLDKCKKECKRLGLSLHPELSLNHNPIALVDFAKGDMAGKELARKHGFYSDAVSVWGESFFPGTMWDVVARRRDGDAIIAFVGDDRGWSDNWEYFVVVVWSPEELEKEVGYTPALL